MPTGVHLSEATISDWVNSATRNVLERVNAVEAISSLQYQRGGRVTLDQLEDLFRDLVNDESILFTKYTARYLLEHPPEEFTT